MKLLNLPIASTLLAVFAITMSAAAREGVTDLLPIATSNPGAHITQPGSYVLANTVTMATAGGTAVRISASNVTLDLNGQSLIGATSPAAESENIGILIDSGVQNVQVKNGTIRGFNHDGISDSGTYSKYTSLQVHRNGRHGTAIYGSGAVLRDVRCTSNTATGLLLAGEKCRISDGVFSYNGGHPTEPHHGLHLTTTGTLVERCLASGNMGDGIHLESATDCALKQNVALGNAGNGFAISGANGNLLLGNRARGNLAPGTPSENYNFNATTQTYGTIQTTTGSVTTSGTDNFEY